MNRSVDDDLYINLHSTIADIPAIEWDGLNIAGYPFASHAFLSALEKSGSVGAIPAGSRFISVFVGARTSLIWGQYLPIFDIIPMAELCL